MLNHVNPLSSLAFARPARLSPDKSFGFGVAPLFSAFAAQPRYGPSRSMNYYKKKTEAAERAQARRELENAAPRLAIEVPTLATLKLELEEHEGTSRRPEQNHIRHIVVASAPALFMVPCGDSRCKDGGHDITRDVMRSLRSGETKFQGTDACQGSQGSGLCVRVLHYTGIATYR
jgi:hypothetical protein